MAYLTSFVLLSLQIICFVFMYNKKAEFLSIILLLALHVIFLLQFVTLNRNGLYVTVLPFLLLGWDGRLPLSVLFVISWILLLTTFAIFVNTYRRLHGTYGSIDKEVDLGDRINYTLKENVKRSVLFSTIIMWVLFGYEIIGASMISHLVRQNQNRYLNQLYWSVQKSSNNVILFTSCLSLTTTSFSIYLADQFDKKMNVITNPK